jgi:hypothetical protein
MIQTIIRRAGKAATDCEGRFVFHREPSPDDEIVGAHTRRRRTGTQSNLPIVHERRKIACSARLVRGLSTKLLQVSV